jgi:hypothetical protein
MRIPRRSGSSPLESSSKQPQLATAIVGLITTLAPAPRHQRWIIVGGRCDTIIRPVLSRFPFRRFCF